MWSCSGTGVHAVPRFHVERSAAKEFERGGERSLPAATIDLIKDTFQTLVRVESEQKTKRRTKFIFWFIPRKRNSSLNLLFRPELSTEWLLYGRGSTAPWRMQNTPNPMETISAVKSHAQGDDSSQVQEGRSLFSGNYSCQMAQSVTRLAAIISPVSQETSAETETITAG